MPCAVIVNQLATTVAISIVAIALDWMTAAWAIALCPILASLALLIFGGILGGVMGVLATQPNQQEIGGIVPITQGIVGALAFTYVARRIEVKRFYYLAAFSSGIGLVIGAVGVGVVLGLSFFYLSIGLTMIVTGCLALLQYLRSHEPVDLNGESQ